jgi:hypothetical protein
VKLIIQIPCLNEEEQLPLTISELPREVPGFDTVEWMIIDDGSTDRTVEVAAGLGVDHIVSLPKNLGLARAFQQGLQAALALGADVVVNTDADRQYPASSIPALVAPVLAGRADVVIGDRGVGDVADFSRLKRRLQTLGSGVVSAVAGTTIPDATSGFRAYSRRAAQSVVVVNSYTYTLESAIQASKKGLTIVSVPIEKNPATRESRLFRSTSSYVRKSTGTIVRVFASYEPLRFFGGLAALCAVAGLGAFVPFLWSAIVDGDTDGHLQSIILGAIFMIAAVQLMALAVVGDLVHAHRVVSERTLEAVRRLELSDNPTRPPYLVHTNDLRWHAPPDL